MRVCMNSVADNDLKFTYVFIGYFMISGLQRCQNALFEQFVRRQEVPHEDTAHDRGLELGIQQFFFNKKLFGPKRFF